MFTVESAVPLEFECREPLASMYKLSPFVLHAAKKKYELLLRVERSEVPLLTPDDRRAPEDTDIAFASSAVAEADRIALYYSVADRYCMRAILRS